MVEKWSTNKKQGLDLEYIRRGEKDFIDSRGNCILNGRLDYLFS